MLTVAGAAVSPRAAATGAGIMAAPPVIVCPECDKKFKGREGLEGKKIKCPACGSDFIVQSQIRDKGGSAARPKAPPAPPKVPAPPPAAAEPGDGDGMDQESNPYGVDTPELKARCPNCANPLESEGALICLFCGYNTQTRGVGKTRKVIRQTGGTHFKWLLPGLICALSMLIIYIANMWYIFILPSEWPGGFLNAEWARLWVGMMSMALIWGLGIFAFKRLILQPSPPEVEKD
jgi:DNA-directed RNA polymerase subunit RPC12/RpoP